MVEMTAAEKVELITRGLQEVLKKNIIEDVIVKENRALKVYWGSFLLTRALWITPSLGLANI